MSRLARSLARSLANEEGRIGKLKEVRISQLGLFSQTDFDESFSDSELKGRLLGEADFETDSALAFGQVDARNTDLIDTASEKTTSLDTEGTKNLPSFSNGVSDTLPLKVDDIKSSDDLDGLYSTLVAMCTTDSVLQGKEFWSELEGVGDFNGVTDSVPDNIKEDIPDDYSFTDNGNLERPSGEVVNVPEDLPNEDISRPEVSPDDLKVTEDAEIPVAFEVDIKGLLRVDELKATDTIPFKPRRTCPCTDDIEGMKQQDFELGLEKIFSDYGSLPIEGIPDDVAKNTPEIENPAENVEGPGNIGDGSGNGSSPIDGVGQNRSGMISYD